MKIVAINSSPKAEAGHTAQILVPFLDGMKDAGAAVELFYQAPAHRALLRTVLLGKHRRRGKRE